MSRSYVPVELRRRVAQQARWRCGYCLTAESIVGTLMDVEHIVPECLGGPTEEENLWLACSGCNSSKGGKTKVLDPLTGQMVTLFNPRGQIWEEHFSWIDAGARISGLTAVGRATVGALKLNRTPLVQARRRWVIAGWHPPKD